MAKGCGGGVSLIEEHLMIRVKLIVEGVTEREFVLRLLRPYLLDKNIDCIPIKMGGDVGFYRAVHSIEDSMQKDKNAYVSTMFDFYGIRGEWPGKKDVKNLVKTGKQMTSIEIGRILNAMIIEELKQHFTDDRINMARFKPYFQVHEFEALVFCDRNILAASIGCNPGDSVFKGIDFNHPEMINDTQETSPSYRLINVFGQKGKSYDKIYTGIEIAKEIGIDPMRNKCPNFNAWLKELENLKPLH